MLGPAETVGGSGELFDLADRDGPLYVRKPVAARVPFFVAGRGETAGIDPATRVDPRIPSIVPDATSAEREADRILARYAPPGVLVDDNLQLAAALRAAVIGGSAPSDGTTELDDGRTNRGDSSGDVSESADATVSAWTFDGPVDRTTVMAEIGRRSAANRGVISRTGARTHATAAQPATAALPLRRLRPVPPPPATSARPGVATVKKVIRRVIAWEVDPLREQLVRLQKASLQAAETTDARLEELSDEMAHDSPTDRPGPPNH